MFAGIPMNFIQFPTDERSALSCSMAVSCSTVCGLLSPETIFCSVPDLAVFVRLRLQEKINVQYIWFSAFSYSCTVLCGAVAFLHSLDLFFIFIFLQYNLSSLSSRHAPSRL